jgi:tRNA (guanine37-N1)-methyltransferase
VQIAVVTMFPGYFEGPLQTSIVGRAIEDGALTVELIDLRRHGIGKHRQLDDAPFGGGPGMVMMVEPLAAALQPVAGSHRVLFTPSGEPMTQDTLDRWAGMEKITFVCGRFEGVDQRVIDRYIDEETSLGDYVSPGARRRRRRRSKVWRGCCPAWWATPSRRRKSLSATVCWRSRCTPGRPSSKV